MVKKKKEKRKKVKQEEKEEIKEEEKEEEGKKEEKEEEKEEEKKEEKEEDDKSGNISVDPCFADPDNRDYHLKSQAGRWDPVSQSWVQDDITSPCIDTGDPDTEIESEPSPNGDIINMGAYGGTEKASKSPENETPLVDLETIAYHRLRER